MSLRERYSGPERLPLGAYAGLVGVFSVVAGAVLFRHARRGTFPAAMPMRDVALLGLATHKLTRIVAKDWVTSPFRAPFARYEGPAPGGEVRERSRGHGLQRAIGDLVTCNYCTGPWVALGLTAAYLESPRAARTIAAVFGAVAVSDWLHRAYEQIGERPRRARAESRGGDAGGEWREVHPDDVGPDEIG